MEIFNLTLFSRILFLNSNGESLRLAYQDLTIQQKQNELKLSKMNDTKKEQALRLGMGMGKTE